MGGAAVVEHALSGVEFQWYGPAFVGIGHRVAGGFEALVRPQTGVRPGYNPHAAIIEGSVVEGHPARDDGVILTHPEIIVVLVPGDFAAGTRRFVQPLAQDQL